MSARLIIVGPPGAGKGTQSRTLVEKFGLAYISTGDIFRKNIADGTEMGKLAKHYIDEGNLVPDEVTDAMVRDRLSQDDARIGFLLDGYPRNVHQVAELDRILSDLGTKLDGVIQLDVSDDDVVARLTKRAEIEGRSDDEEGIVRHRLSVYHGQTQPVLALYEERGDLLKINGIGTVEEVLGRIEAALKPRLGE